MSILTKEDRNFLDEQGYVVVPSAVPPENCDAVIDAIWEFLGLDRNNPETWYQLPLTPGGMIEMYQHQAMWNNRQHPRLYEIFAEVLGQRELAVTIDRVGMKPPFNPTHPEYDHKGFTHWDVNTAKLPTQFGVQAVLCLDDTEPNMGGFQCIPGFHKNLPEWIAGQPADHNPHIPDLNALPTGMKVVPIPAKKGDLVIWNNILAHGNGRNLSDRPRYSQYISMFPASRLNDDVCAVRTFCWQNRMAPGGNVFFGDPRKQEERFGTTADLTSLGRKLLGAERW